MKVFLTFHFFPRRTDLVIDVNDTNIKLLTYKLIEPVKIQMTRLLERVDINSELAANLTPIEIKPGLMISTITGTLSAKNNRFEINALNKSQIQQLQAEFDVNLPPFNYTYGQLDVAGLLHKLAKEGITDAKLEQLANNCTLIHLHLKTGDALIRIDDNKTHICCDSVNNDLRKLLGDLVSQCLKKF